MSFGVDYKRQCSKRDVVPIHLVLCANRGILLRMHERKMRAFGMHAGAEPITLCKLNLVQAAL